METIPLALEDVPPEEMKSRAAALVATFARRRTVRDFSDRPLPEGVLESCLEVANSAPSGANLQPWHFAVVRDPAMKRRIREGAEAEERAFYEGRASEEWLRLLAPLGTDWRKPFLEKAPALVAVFARNRAAPSGPGGGAEVKTYYPKESAGIALGFLIAALHQAGLATLTHTPSPMGFLSEALGRPPGDKPFVLLVVGYPDPGCRVPAITKKPLAEVCSEH